MQCKTIQHVIMWFSLDYITLMFIFFMHYISHFPSTPKRRYSSISTEYFLSNSNEFKRAQKYVLLFSNGGSKSTHSNHLWYLDLDALLLWHSFLQRRTDNCIWYPLKSSYTAVSAHLCILTVVIISLSAIFAINLSWHDNLRLFYLRCFVNLCSAGWHGGVRL